MIRKFETNDLTDIMTLWLDSNLDTHIFIPSEYWLSNFYTVKSIIPSSETYVYEQNKTIAGFIGINNGIIEGLFVDSYMRSKGIGKELLNKAKDIHKNLTLSVYEKNKEAIRFYIRENFVIKQKQIDKNTGEYELLMIWNCT